MLALATGNASGVIMSRDPGTLVVGAGLLGVLTAWELLARGQPVTLLEAAPGVGRATSYANGGLLTRAMCDPWNAPGIERQVLGSLFRRNAPLQLRAAALPSLPRWGLKLLRRSTPAWHRYATHASFALADYSLRRTAELSASLSLEFAAATRGTLKIVRRAASAAAAFDLAQFMETLGLRYHWLEANQVIDLEPQLAELRTELAGALYFPDDGCGDAFAFCEQLARTFTDRGGRLLTDCEVLQIRIEHDRTVGVLTQRGLLEAGRVIVAAGNGSTALLRAAGVALPIHPVKGYSLSINCADAAALPQIPVADRAVHGAVIPLGRRLRVVGSAELAGIDLRVRQRTVDGLWRLLASIYPHLAARLDRTTAQAWAGLRPMSADGLPFIGATRVAGLYVNTGHGHMGWTHAAGSAALLADLLLGQRPAIDPRPFDPSRS